MPDRPDPVDVLRELATLADQLGGAIGVPDDGELLGAAVTAGRAMFDARSCSIALLDDDQEELVYRAATDEAIVGVRLPVSRGIAGWVVSAGQATAVDDVARDPRFARDVAESVGYVPTSIVVAPLQTARDVLGAISVLDPGEDSGPSARRLDQLGAYAEPVALAIESSRRFWDVGRALLASVEAVADGEELHAALRAAADRPGDPRADLAAMAAQLAELGGYGPPERQAAGDLIEAFLVYLRSRPG